MVQWTLCLLGLLLVRVFPQLHWVLGPPWVLVVRCFLMLLLVLAILDHHVVL